ncbi:MAG: hypothetical protein CMB80_16525 [Flammeovirgaceae bacterium]|nr:hypothetical protein [Flammeovirgaceae bacterium]
MDKSAILYYGNGECTIDGGGTDILGIEIRYNGEIKTITKTANENFTLMHRDNCVLIFPFPQNNTSHPNAEQSREQEKIKTDFGSLSNLFVYMGTLNIKSAIVADSNGAGVRVTIKKVMDYAELLDTKAEDMTTKSDDLRSAYSSVDTSPSGIKVKKNFEHDFIKNLYSDNEFYLSDGALYKGLYHIHLVDSAAMTGSEYTNDSQDLYIKQMMRGKIVNILIPTRNPSNVPQAVNKQKKIRLI